MNIPVEVAKILISIKAVDFRFNPPFTYTSGLQSPIYLDNRIIMSYPAARKKIVNFYLRVIKERIGSKNVDYISGTATAAVPQASWVSGELDLPMVYVRPTTKSYGKGNKLEGYLKTGSKVIIIEDHISTATSVANNAETIRESGGIVKYCVATTTYETSQSKGILKKLGITLYSLTTGKVIVEQAAKAGILSSDEKGKVELWFNDPASWAKRMGVEK